MVPYSETEKNLIFLLDRNNKMTYWFKNETDKNRSPKKINYGSWEVNFADSTIRIEFGKNYTELKPIVGKYIKLNAHGMSFEITSYFEQVYKGKLEKLKQITILDFVHNQFGI
jgi:hypothetical protein